jgi:hypothetical protein
MQPAGRNSAAYSANLPAPIGAIRFAIARCLLCCTEAPLEAQNTRFVPREKAGGRYAIGLPLQLPARVRFRCDSMTRILRKLG